jgi:hypothetical protein
MFLDLGALLLDMAAITHAFPRYGMKVLFHFLVVVEAHPQPLVSLRETFVHLHRCFET